MMDILAHPGLRQIADVILIVLLGATLAYVRRLERNLDRLRGDRTVFERMLEGFAERTRQAEAALHRFQSASDGISRELAAQIAVATALRNELGTAAARAEVLGQDLRSAIVADDRDRRPSAGPARFEEAERIVPADDAPGDRPRSRAERELLHALRGTR